MGFLWFIAICWAIFFGVASLIAHGFGAFLFFLLAFAPVAALIWFKMQRTAKNEAAHSDMCTLAGVTAGAGFDHAENDTGIAINKVARTLTLRIGAKVKTYLFTDIREWQTSKERAGMMHGTGLSGASVALGANIRAEREAKENTGLFMTVRDVDNPKWRIEMNDANIQARWMELLRQEVNES